MSGRNKSGHRAPLGDAGQGKWVWCLHCERAYRQGEERKGHDRHFGDVEACAYADCDGSPLDQWEWQKVAEANGYPETPERGHLYPLYSKL